jgi:hypothetical protein
MFWAFKQSFVVDILALFLLGDCLGYFLNNWAIFFKSSGHPVVNIHELIFELNVSLFKVN